MKLYSVIIPVFNEEEIIFNSYNRIKSVMDKLNNPYELIFVDDGSSDNSYSILKLISEADTNARILVFSKNFGHQIAVSAGMKASKGDAVIIIDADMQDPPELIPLMLNLWKEGNQVVYGKRNNRLGESWFKKVTATVYYRLLKRISEDNIPLDVGDFRLLDRKVVDVMNEMTEHNRYLRGMSAWAGFTQAALPYTREERKQGTSKYTLKKMTKLAADGALSMSLKPLKMIMVFGIILFILSIIGLIALSIIWLINSFNTTILIISIMTLLTGLILISMGILGAYLGRIYDEVKGRPLYIIKEMINFKE